MYMWPLIFYILYWLFSHIPLFLWYIGDRWDLERSAILEENYDQFKLTVPTLIIATYILFWVLPNFLMFFVRINILEISLTLQRIIILMYRFGLITDPLIYVLNTNNRKSKTLLTNLSGQCMLKAVGGSASKSNILSFVLNVFYTPFYTFLHRRILSANDSNVSVVNLNSELLDENRLTKMPKLTIIIL